MTRAWITRSLTTALVVATLAATWVVAGAPIWGGF